jgi:protein-S-isoprenylcysteine O-methyltransferase Ste14
MLRLIAGLLILGSLVLAILSFISLNQSFALRPKPSAKGKLVTSGIYAYIQHPMYTSVLVFFLGACILLLSFRSFVILPLLALWMFLKSGVEEKFLLKVYQTDYRDYSKKTGRFLPRINRWR